jgi:hypothetical protein
MVICCLAINLIWGVQLDLFTSKALIKQELPK